MARMKILSSSEYSLFETPPVFTSTDRKQFFNFSKSLLKISQTLRNPVHKVGFLVSCGYFQATKRFFSPDDFRERDIDYVIRSLGISDREIILSEYSERTRQRHQKLILDYYGFQSFDQKAENILNIEIASMVRIYLKPRLIFDRCVDLLSQKRIQIPNAYTLTEHIRLALQVRKIKLIQLMEKHLPHEMGHLLDTLFETTNGGNRYRLTLLKKLSQSTKPAKVKECIEDFDILSELYHQLNPVLARLDLGHSGIRYYAGSVLRSEIFQMTRRSDTDRYIHATAFITHQFYRVQDNLVDIFLNVVAAFENSTSREHKEQSYAGYKEQTRKLKSLLSGLDKNVFSVLQEIRNLTRDVSLSDTEKISEIRELLNHDHEKNFDNIRSNFEILKLDQSYHDILEEYSLRLQNRAAPILKSIIFQGNSRSVNLMEAIIHFKKKDSTTGSKPPLEFLDEKEKNLSSEQMGQSAFHFTKPFYLCMWLAILNRAI